jgi:hypothetical protein
VSWILRLAALMGAGAYGVHQLRFVISPSNGATVRAHAYLAPVGAIVVALLLFVLAAALARVARGVVEGAPRLRRLWLGASASLMAVYCVQETIEKVVTEGDRQGLFARGGWVALPLALAIGLAIALLMRGANAASEVAANAHAGPAIDVAPTAIDSVLAPATPRRTRPVARHQAARGPPLASV